MVTPVYAVVPAPSSIAAAGAAPFALAATTTVTTDTAVADAAYTLVDLIHVRTGLTLETTAKQPVGIHLSIAPGGTPESYRITVDPASVTITGADAAGLFYGIQTLGQLISRTGDGWTIPAVRIDDSPRFAYRGVMLDVARHFHDVTTVKAFIDRAASLKFNRLHLHLTDDQGWRLHLDSRPLLTERASATAIGGDPGGFFSQDDYRAIIAHAASRHMTVVPEIDLPGHTHAVSLAYSELSEEPVITDHIREIVRDFGGGMPVNGTPYEGMAVGFSSLRIHDEATWAFLEDVLGEVAGLTPGPYLHVGGDEALGTDAGDYAAFMDRVTALAARHGKTPVAWHEAGASPGIHPSTVGQYWGYVTPENGMDEKARTFVARGSSLILSPADAIYLDMKFDADSPLGLTWARGVTSARRAYEWDPAAVIPGVGDDGILGVEAPLWSETVRTAADIDALAFPRIAAAAEAAWSVPLGASDERTWESFAARVGALAPLWTRLGIGFTPLPEIPWATDDAAAGA
ncbi:MAG: beta-N-acetylhexosaminidase [Microbacterium sp.]|nr:MAG: beta-N-acetylhexosaminidase [Microbacterium sp.]